MLDIRYDENNLPELANLIAKNYDQIDENDKTGVKRIAVLTSGGDAPGMNATIRAVVRAGINAVLTCSELLEDFMDCGRVRYLR